MRARRASWIAALLVVAWSAPAAAIVCVSPGGGQNYGLTDLAAACADLGGAGGLFTANDDVVVLPIDSLTLAPGEVLEFAPGYGLEIQGTLNVNAAGNPATLRGIGAADWAGLRLLDGAMGSLTGLDVQGAQVGIAVADVPAAVWSNVRVSDSLGDGFVFDGTGGDLSLFQCEAQNNGGSGFHFRNTRTGPSLQEVTAAFNGVGITLDGAGPDGKLRDSAIDDNAGLGVDILAGASRFAITGGSISRNGGGALLANGTGTVAGDAIRISGTTLTDSGVSAIRLSGSAGARLTSVVVTDGLAGDGVVLSDVWDAEVAFSTVERSASGTGITVISAQPGQYAAVADATPHWVDVTAGTANDWMPGGDSATLGPFALPFGFPVGGTLYSRFVQHADGVVELLTSADTPAPLPAGQGWAPIAHAYPGRVFLFAQTDDWCSDCDPAFDPGLTFAGFGWDYLQSGETDASGTKVEADTVAFVWKTQSFADVGIDAGRNEFGVHLSPDGSIRWSVNTMEAQRAPRGVFNGALLPSGTLLVASRYQLVAASLRFDPGDPSNPLAIPTTLNGNVIRENGDAGILVSACRQVRIWDNGLAGNGVGITHGGSSLQTRLVYNNLAGNGDPVGSAELENTQEQQLVARDNWWGVTTAAEIDNRILDDEENVLYKAVEFSPWREAPIQPGPPGPLQGLIGDPMDGAVRLTWDPSDAPDLAGYQVRWGTQTGQWSSVVDLDDVSPDYELTGLTNGTNYFITVAARDLAGNVGAAAGEIEAVPVEDPPPPKGFFEGGGCKCALDAPAHTVPPRATLLVALLACLFILRRRR